MERGHVILLREFLNDLTEKNITRILDAGSGKTSLSAIAAYFPEAHVDAVVYPGDERKLCSIRPMLTETFRAVEQDICRDPIDGTYDLVVAHLLLGEAAKFGNSFETLLEQLLAVKSRYVILIDYSEDPNVDEAAIESLCQRNHLTILRRTCVENADPQIWEDFTGTHNFGYLIEKNLYCSLQ